MLRKDYIGKPLVVKPRSIYRILDSHPPVYQVRKHLEHSIDDGTSARASV